MARKLTFAPWTKDKDDSSVMFTNLYHGFIGRTDSPNRAHTIEETRNAIKVLDALDSVSTITEMGQYSTRVLQGDGGSIELTEDGHKLLQTAIDAFVGSLPFAMARAGIALKTFVDDAEKV